MPTLLACPRCGEEIGDDARICPNCCASGSQLYSPQRLYELAYWQKRLLYAVLGSILVGVSLAVMTIVDPESPHGTVLALWIVLLCLSTAGLGAWSWYKLGRALGMPIPGLLISEIFLVVPYVSIMALLFMTVRVTGELRSAGVPVGLMGANLQKLPREA